MGQLVRTLENRRLGPGPYSVHWDGTNSDGQTVSSGVYFYKMQADGFSATRKMMLLR
jgi:flagellar hook assembly protein FlgD